MVNKGKAQAQEQAHEAMTQMPQNTSGTTEIERSESQARKNLSVRKKSLKPTPRRSSRLQSLIQPVKNVEVEHIDLVESEMDNDTDLDKTERELEHFVEEAEPIPEGKSLEERVDQLVEVVEVLKHKVNSGNFSTTSSSSLNYKGLYIYSQKKIDELTKENVQLQNQLQLAQVKIEAYDNLKDDVLDKLKDVIMVSNMGKAADAVINLCNKVLDRFLVPSSNEPGQTHVTRSPSRDVPRKRGNKQDSSKN